MKKSEWLCSRPVGGQLEDGVHAAFVFAIFPFCKLEIMVF